MAAQDFALVGPDGSIVNRIVVETDEAGEPTGYAPEDGHALVPDPSGLAEIGGRWTGLSFEPPATAPSESSPEDVPLAITRGQLETLLASLGYTPEAIATAIAAATP